MTLSIMALDTVVTVILSVIMLRIVNGPIMINVLMLNVVIQSVVAPIKPVLAHKQFNIRGFKDMSFFNSHLSHTLTTMDLFITLSIMTLSITATTVSSAIMLSVVMLSVVFFIIQSLT
jgi:hypothetical protein